MQNDPSTAGNPRLPADAEAAKKTKEGAVGADQERAEGELERSEREKEQDTRPEDKEPFNVDKVDDLEKSKKGEKED